MVTVGSGLGCVQEQAVLGACREWRGGGAGQSGTEPADNEALPFFPLPPTA